MTRLLVLSVTVFLLIAGAAEAATKLSFQGTVSEGGTPLTGEHEVTFRLFADSLGGSSLWSESYTLSFQQGRFAVRLGSVNPLPQEAYTLPGLWVETEAQATVLPRQRLEPAHAAIYADSARVAGSSSTGDQLWSTDGTNVWRGVGKVGIGQLSPEFALDVGSGDARFQRTIGGTDFIISPTTSDIRLFSQANLPLNLGTSGDAFMLSLRADGRINVKNSLGIGPATPWGDNGIYLDAGSQNSTIQWNNRSSTGFILYQAASSDAFYFSSTGGGSLETWNYTSAGLGNLFTIGPTVTSYRNVQVNGSFTATGTKCREVDTSKYGKLYFSATEDANALFTVGGESKLQNGQATIALDPRWLAGVTINERHPMQVWITFYGAHGEYFVERGLTGFIVHDASSSNAAFGWKVEARQRGYEDLYLDRPEAIAVSGRE